MPRRVESWCGVERAEIRQSKRATRASCWGRDAACSASTAYESLVSYAPRLTSVRVYGSESSRRPTPRHLLPLFEYLYSLNTTCLYSCITSFPLHRPRGRTPADMKYNKVLQQTIKSRARFKQRLSFSVLIYAHTASASGSARRKRTATAQPDLPRQLRPARGSNSPSRSRSRRTLPRGKGSRQFPFEPLRKADGQWQLSDANSL